MRALSQKISLFIKAFWQLGPQASLLYARYRILLSTGALKRRTPAGPYPPPHPIVLLKIDLPNRQELTAILGGDIQSLRDQADEITSGQVRLFGAPPGPLVLTPPALLKHWSAHTAAWTDGQDVKFIWEPGRFGWATLLARAYHLTGEESYAQTFWRCTEEFLGANPPNLGPHWASAQEVALRLVALTFSYHLVQGSSQSTPKRKELLAAGLAAHAARIPPTLAYARAQGNNHLLTEAAGLYTAAALLPAHPQSARWRALGWRWFNRGIQAQVTPHGVYAQHSANYHRLMLQTALWMGAVAAAQGDTFPPATQSRLATAARWLLALLDEESGRVPNLGANDGAYILPLTICPFEDYRPVLQAAGRAFLGETPLPPGPWDEITAWLSPPAYKPKSSPPVTDLIRLDGQRSWGTLRAARFNSRPSHADQLHLDLWWRGRNLALDAGSYLYNAPPPWDNTLAGAAVHNTITINGQDQMTRAGRFLWLDWAQAQVLERSPTHALAQHDGYRKLGLVHRRRVEITPPDTWTITDQLIPLRKPGGPVTARLHWLLPDWPWQLDGTTLNIQSPSGWVTLQVASNHPLTSEYSLTPTLARAGGLLHGNGAVEPIRGWVSPTYGLKHPALSFALETTAPLPITIISTFILPTDH